ncbi:MAG: DNA adenine methylase [Gammaproteobacteria bacterium]|jgi:DNA adenine methylase|nr:DNA adenine methylase [Polaromonas sp.]MBP6156100.1 DNA adenine methylase [Polaromonas sp.]MBP7308618.1 DNA adenine methylase [Polaromonas sp.]MBP8873858.1 DNA adenine methylase [Polaromonas sp.]MBP9727623.1 DNA adenine methylase [Gammaproteobacteria bacterium]
MFSNKLYSPLRYPGGKARFAPFISRLMEINNLANGHYLEPYAGGAGVALELLFHGIAEKIHINDLDPAIYDFWKAITTVPDEILRLLHDTPVNIEQWHYWRSILRREIQVDLAERGFATLFMNRTNRSGVLKGGVIGGLKQDGAYRMDARMNKSSLALRIEMVALHASCISIYQEDALSLLSRCQAFLPRKSLIYLDPPYYVKGQGLYRNFYEHEDHVKIANLLQEKNFPSPWVVSYDNVSEIQAMYKTSRSLTYGLNYTAQVRYIGSEVMFSKTGLKIPESFIPIVKVAA